ncbi:MAG: peptide-methionine (R)-S-oxide reductase MsrB [Halococcoides sp.]
MADTDDAADATDRLEGAELPDTEAGWRARLSERAYRVLREGATEPRFSGELLEVDDDGVFRCAGCRAALFDSTAKFDSGTGWPSFADADSDAVETRRDRSHGMDRTEVLCANCGGHLGHVFDDGPEPTGKRYCINDAALAFDASE